MKVKNGGQVREGEGREEGASERGVGRERGGKGGER